MSEKKYNINKTKQNTKQLIIDLSNTNIQSERTKLVADWLKNITDDRVRMRFVLNWTIPHSIFNVMSKIIHYKLIQNINWYQIHKMRDVGMWNNGNKPSF